MFNIFITPSYIINKANKISRYADIISGNIYKIIAVTVITADAIIDFISFVFEQILLVNVEKEVTRTIIIIFLAISFTDVFGLKINVIPVTMRNNLLFIL